jgi:23S rRNA (adenine-N6)-dimethyltransferase
LLVPSNDRSAHSPVGPGENTSDRRRQFGQNFFRTAADAARFAGQLRIPDGIPVVEVGSGSGRITEVLSGRGDAVTAVEIDDAWADRLRKRQLRGVQVVAADFLEWEPEQTPVAYVGNLPFGTGTQILRQVLESGPDQMYRAAFLLQAEYVGKRVGKWGENLFNAQWKPWFEFDEGIRFRRETFQPIPRTDTSTLLIDPRGTPSIGWERRESYQDFVTQIFGTGNFSIGEACRTLAGRSGTRALSRVGISGDIALKHLGLEHWEPLYRDWSGQPAGRSH